MVVLTGLKDDKARLYAFPALLDQLNAEEDRDTRRLVDAQLNGKDAVYSTPEKVSALLKLLNDPDPSPLRPTACEGFGPAVRLEIYGCGQSAEDTDGLEANLLDPAPEAQTAAAESLELCDAIDRAKLDPKQAAVKHTVYLRLNDVWLRSQQRRPEEVLNLIKAGYPTLGAKMNGETVIECQATDIDLVVLLNRLRVPKKTGTKLRDFVRVDVAPAGQK